MTFGVNYLHWNENINNHNIKHAESILLATSNIHSHQMSKQVVGNYEVGELLGKGSFARVHKCKDVRNGKTYAMKVIKKQSLSNTQIDRL